jgi:hypothetical protein
MQAVNLMEKDGFKIEFRAEQIEKIRSDPGTHLDLTRDLPPVPIREEP